MGLRDRKKAELRERILERSVEMFRDRGYRPTSTREIAGQLQISQATFFNYFARKDFLLGAWIDRMLGLALAEVTTASRGRNPRRCIRDLVRIISPRLAEDREFARIAFGQARLCGDVGPPRPDVAVEFFREAQSLGRVRSDLPPEQLALLLTAAFRTSVAAWLHLPDEDPTPLAPQLAAALDLLLDGCQPRHQRVRPRPARVDQPTRNPR